MDENITMRDISFGMTRGFKTPANRLEVHYILEIGDRERKTFTEDLLFFKKEGYNMIGIPSWEDSNLKNGYCTFDNKIFPKWIYDNIVTWVNNNLHRGNILVNKWCSLHD